MGTLLSLSRDVDAINAVVNDPAVRPFVGAPELGPADVSPLVERDENLFLMGEHGGFGLVWTAPRTHEVHTFIKPEGRGAWAFAAAGEMIHTAASSGIRTLWTKIDPKHRHTRHFARRMGMRETGEQVFAYGERWPVYAMEAA